MRSSVKGEPAGRSDRAWRTNIAASVLPAPAAAPETKVDQNAMFKLSYGLFLLTARRIRRTTAASSIPSPRSPIPPSASPSRSTRLNLTHDMICPHRQVQPDGALAGRAVQDLSSITASSQRPRREQIRRPRPAPRAKTALVYLPGSTLTPCSAPP